MILGANLVVGAVAFAYWAVSLGCAMGAADGRCTTSGWSLFADLMGSSDGVIFWLVIVVGVLVFWWGKRVRGR